MTGFSRALAGFEHRDDVEVVYRSFELDPSMPPGQVTPVLDVLAVKYGISHAQARDAGARVAALAAGEGLDPCSAGEVLEGGPGAGEPWPALAAQSRDPRPRRRPCP